MRISFSEWLPDQPGVIGALTNAQNVYPKAVGYGPFPSADDYSAAASQNLNNVVGGVSSTGTTKVFASGSTLLFLLDSSDLSLDNVSALTYTTVTDRWRFTQFGDYLIAAGSPNTLQYYDLTTTNNFANLSSDAPQASVVTVVRDFVVSGNTPTNSNRVQWSGINDATTWTTSAVTQSDFQDIPDGGAVKGLSGGEFGLVLCERSIYRMSYVGTPLVFQFDNIARNRGCYEANSVIQWQAVTYFLSDDGFYACDGQNIIPIGAEKVNRFFFNDVAESEITRMSAAVDPSRNLILWGYPSIEQNYRILMYHPQTQRWSYADSDVDRIASFSAPKVTVEGLDAFSASLDALPFSLDSRVWLGGRLTLSGVSDTKIINFSGANLNGEIETSDIGEGQTTMITLAKPIVDNGSATVGIASRLLLDEEVSFGSQTAADSENRVGLRSVGKYHRIKVTPTGDNWTTAIGVDLELRPAGGR